MKYASTIKRQIWADDRESPAQICTLLFYIISSYLLKTLTPRM